MQRNQNGGRATGCRAAIHTAIRFRGALRLGIAFRPCGFVPVRDRLNRKAAMTAVGLRLTCEKSEGQHNEKKENRRDPRQDGEHGHRRDAARWRAVVLRLGCRFLNQSSAPVFIVPLETLIAGERRNGSSNKRDVADTKHASACFSTSGVK